MLTMTETEYKNELEKWGKSEKEKKAKEEKIKDTDWICEFC